jgi:hypothetical protein
MVGIKNRTFAYVANARKDKQDNLILGGPAASSIHFGKDIPAHEIDMGEGAFLLSAAYATQLLTPPAPPETEPNTVTPAPVGSTQLGQPSPPVYPLPGDGGKKVNEPPVPTIPAMPPARPVAPSQSGQRYHLRLNCKPDDLFEVMKALNKLNEHSMSMNVTVFAVASAKPDHPFIANTLHNLVVEPMLEESDVVIQEEQVEE